MVAFGILGVADDDENVLGPNHWYAGGVPLPPPVAVKFKVFPTQIGELLLLVIEGV